MMRLLLSFVLVFLVVQQASTTKCPLRADTNIAVYCDESGGVSETASAWEQVFRFVRHILMRVGNFDPSALLVMVGPGGPTNQLPTAGHPTRQHPLRPEGVSKSLDLRHAERCCTRVSKQHPHRVSLQATCTSSSCSSARQGRQISTVSCKKEEHIWVRTPPTVDRDRVI